MAATAAQQANVKMPEKAKDFIQSFADFMDAYPGSGFREIIRLIPDGLFVGTGLFALLSQNYPVAVFFGTIFEILLITLGLQSLFGYISLPDVFPTPQAMSPKCISGFQSPTVQTMSVFFNMAIKSAYPSPPIFVFTAASMYVISSMQQFIPEIQELGPGFSTRFYLGIFFTCLLILVISVNRLLNRCDTWGIIAFSILTGLGLGIVLAYQNKTLFGKESINIMGIPVFQNTTADGKPIYICPNKLVPGT
jgi:hypothetical protein